MENCSQCDREFNKKHLSPIISELAKNKAAFRKVFKSENPKFCRPCRLQWLELGKVRGDKVEEFIENMTFAKRIKTSESDDNFDTTLEVPGHSGMQNNVSDVTSALNDQVPGSSVMQNSDSEVTPASNEQVGENFDQDAFLHAEKERDQWYQLWINGFCSSETGDEYLQKMEKYATKWKESERKMKQINQKYEPLV